MTTAEGKKICSSSSRGGGAVVIRIDEIEEILARLPVKHVLRCKLLSKTYYNLINNPSFINKHLLLHHRPQSSDHKTILMSKNLHNRGCNRMFSILDDEEEEALFVPSTRFLRYTTIVGSSNGLLVLQLTPDDEDLTVCNPATREHLRIPNPNLQHMPVKPYMDALGFGHDPKSGDYKLVKIGDYSHEGNNGPCFYMIEIWTMSTNTWKQLIPHRMPRLFLDKAYEIIRPYYALSVNGTLYWLAYAKDQTDRDAAILSFDPTNDTFGQILLPKDVVLRRDFYDLSLIDFSGSLALSIGLPSGESHRLFDIWVMNKGDDTSSSLWNKRFSIGPLPLDVRATRVYTDGKFVFRRIVHCYHELRECWEFILYDPQHNKVLKQSTVHDCHTLGTVWSYAESLVSVPLS